MAAPTSTSISQPLWLSILFTKLRVVVSLKKQRALLPVGVIPKPRVFSSGARDLPRNRPSA